MAKRNCIYDSFSHIILLCKSYYAIGIDNNAGGVSSVRVLSDICVYTIEF